MIQTLNDSGVPSKVVETLNKLSMPITEKLNEYGYAPAVNESKDELGDIRYIKIKINFIVNNFILKGIVT